MNVEYILPLAMTKACTGAWFPLYAAVIHLNTAVVMTVIHWPLDGNDNQSRHPLKNNSLLKCY